MQKLSLTKKYATYPKYKDSGVEWVGDVPKTWDVATSRRLFQTKKKLASETESQKVLSLTLNGVIPRVMDGSGKNPANYDTYQEFLKGDLVFCLFDYDVTPRTIGYVEENGMMTSAYTRLIPKSETDSKFFYYYFLYLDYTKELLHLCTGLRNSISKPLFWSLKNPLPPKEEQEKIARFLDEQTARIDETIAKKERLIELLKEKRTATINHAVTKGLDPNAELVDSGIDWIGKIPKGWEVKKLKYSLVGSGYKAGPFGSSLITENLAKVGKYKVFTPEHVSKNSFDFEYDAYLPDERVFEMSQFIAQEDDVLIPIVGSLGKAAVVPNGSLGIINQRLARLRPNQKILLPQFLKVLLSDSTLLKESSKTDSRGAILEHITKDKILNWFVQLPPVKEQKEIYEFVLRQMNCYDYAINQVTKSKSFLEEFKSSVISHAVTGKIKV